MKIWGKIIIFLIIVVPIIFCYSTIKSLWSEEDISALNNDTQINIPDTDEENQDLPNNLTNDDTPSNVSENTQIDTNNPISKLVEGTINISVANVYIEADTSSESVGTLNKNTTVTAQAYPGGWSKIRADSLTGWVKTEYITLAEGTKDASIGKVVGLSAVVNVTSLNIRAAATASGKWLNSLTENTEVKITEVSDDGEWYKVKWQDLEGWCMKKYLTIK